MIHEIIPGLYVGTIRDAENKVLLKDYNIKIVMNLTGKEVSLPNDVVSIYIPILSSSIGNAEVMLPQEEIIIKDLPDYKFKLKTASIILKTLGRRVRAGEEYRTIGWNILVHCIACIDRTPTVIAMTLKDSTVKSGNKHILLDEYDKVFDFLKTKIPEMFVHDDWVT